MTKKGVKDSLAARVKIDAVAEGLDNSNDEGLEGRLRHRLKIKEKRLDSTQAELSGKS